MFRGGAVLGLEGQGGARQATPEELELRQKEAAGVGLNARTLRGPDIDPELMRVAGNQLIERGRTTLSVGECELTAYVVTFWRGDSLVHIDVRGPGQSRSSTSRVPRKPSVRHLPMLTQYLTDAIHAG